MDAAEEIKDKLKEIDSAYYRLILIVGDDSSQRTALLKSLPGIYVNIGLALSEMLLKFPQEERAYEVSDCFSQLLRGIDKEPVLADNIEILFSPHLRINPLKVLKNESRYRKMVVAWPGLLKNGRLVYAEYGHPEYKVYREDEIEVPILDISGRQKHEV